MQFPGPSDLFQAGCRVRHPARTLVPDGPGISLASPHARDLRDHSAPSSFPMSRATAQRRLEGPPPHHADAAVPRRICPAHSIRKQTRPSPLQSTVPRTEVLTVPRDHGRLPLREQTTAAPHRMYSPPPRTVPTTVLDCGAALPTLAVSSTASTSYAQHKHREFRVIFNCDAQHVRQCVIVHAVDGTHTQSQRLRNEV